MCRPLCGSTSSRRSGRYCSARVGPNGRITCCSLVERRTKQQPADADGTNRRKVELLRLPAEREFLLLVAFFARSLARLHLIRLQHSLAAVVARLTDRARSLASIGVGAPSDELMAAAAAQRDRSQR